MLTKKKLRDLKAKWIILGVVILSAIITTIILRSNEKAEIVEEAQVEEAVEVDELEEELISDLPKSNTGNCTLDFGKLAVVNYNFTVDDDFIAGRAEQLINITDLYGINEAHPYNGAPMLDKEAAEHLNEMLSAYKEAYPGHEMQTMSCFRRVGTQCGRLCAETGKSDHHLGYTCDLIDTTYGSELDTDYYAQHVDWQWLKENSYRYGFIDRYPEEWAGGSMLEPINVDENGSTGLYETWHYRYVGVKAATEIAEGKYNDGKYDSLEHYLKGRGLVKDLVGGVCEK
ncbi:D-alanyl-D-alanine carboxypeptidase family protein [Candidatus Saccharibacteria bacterium]|nr:D-alanyl-D-alanine carboxypeptidase family protein [Candidatus Saccharibacteria bacterium]